MKTSDGAGGREPRAREWIRTLSEIPARFAGSLAERQAADHVAAWMRELGFADVTLASVAARPRSGLALAAHAGLAVFGLLWGGFSGMLLALLAVWSFTREHRHRQPVLSRWLPAAVSVNVTGRLGASVAARRVVLSAHIDTAQAGLIFRPALANPFAGLQQHRDGPPTGPLAVPNALVTAAALLALAAWMGAHGLLFGVLKGASVIGLLVTCGAGLQWATAAATPGANDNASAVASMLTCAEQLCARLPDDVELWLVGTGAEEVGCVGMHAFLDAHPDWPRESTFFINFECTGGGALHVIRTEGLLAKALYPPTLVELARRVAAAGTFGPITPTHLLAGTDGHVPAELGYPTLSLISLEANGVPRNYHRVEDTVDGIDVSLVVRAADFAAAVALAALHGAAGPLQTVPTDQR